MLKKNLLFTLALSVSQFVFPLITFPYTARILGTEGIGAINFIDSFTQYFILFAALGIPAYGIREISRVKNDKELLSKVFSEIFIIHVFSTIFFSLIYLIISLYIPRLFVNFDLALTGLSMMFFTVLSVEWFYSGIEKFSYITMRSLIVRTLSAIAIFLFLKTGTKPVIYYLIISVSVGLTGIFNIFNLHKYIKFRYKQLSFKNHLRPLFIILGSALAVSVYVLLDNMLLGFIKGEEAVGIYSTAVKIVKLPFAILFAINAVIVPQVSLAFGEGRNDMIQVLIDKSFTYLCILGLPICVGLFICSPFLVHTFAGNHFQDSVPVLRILSPVTFLVGMSFIFTAQLLTPTGNERFLIVISIVGMLFSLVLNIFMIRWYSYLGAAITNILTEILITGIGYWFVKKYVGIKIHLKIFFQCLVGAICFVPIAFFIRTAGLSQSLTEILVILSCSISYALFLWFYVKNSYLEHFKSDLLKKAKSLINSIF